MTMLLEDSNGELHALPRTLAEYKITVENFLKEGRTQDKAHQVVLAAHAALQEMYSAALLDQERFEYNTKGIAEFCGYAQLALAALHERHPLKPEEQYDAAQIAAQRDLASELLIGGVRAYERQSSNVTSILGRVKNALPQPKTQSL